MIGLPVQPASFVMNHPVQAAIRILHILTNPYLGEISTRILSAPVSVDR